MYVGDKRIFTKAEIAIRSFRTACQKERRDVSSRVTDCFKDGLSDQCKFEEVRKVGWTPEDYNGAVQSA